MKLRLASEESKRGGWVFDFDMIAEINNEIEREYGYRPGMEEIESVLLYLSKHGLLNVIGLDGYGANADE